MTDKEKEAIEYIKGQLKNNYIDISNAYPDELEFNIVKKAIEHFEDLNHLYGIGVDTLKYTESEYGNSKILLNLIKTQQKELDLYNETEIALNNRIIDLEAEIEKLSNNNKDLLRKLRNRVKEVKKLTKYSLYKKEFATLNKQIKKKDEIINNSINEIERLRQYFSEDLQVEFVRILEILKDKKVIDW